MSVHALVARTVRFRELASARLAALRATAIAVLTGDLRAIEDARAHTILQDVVPHARELARNAPNVTEAGLLGWVARYNDERGAFTSARAQYEQVVDTCRWVLGEEHPEQPRQHAVRVGRFSQRPSAAAAGGRRQPAGVG